jgi:hypothetical protein
MLWHSRVNVCVLIAAMSFCTRGRIVDRLTPPITDETPNAPELLDNSRKLYPSSP